MERLTYLCLVGLLFASAAPAAHAWISFLDGSSVPGDPWLPFINEGSTLIVDIGGGNFALRMDSPEHSDPEPSHGNAYYDLRFGDTDIVGAARFRLVDFSATGKENLLAVTVGGGMAIAPSITLVDGNYWVWSYTSDEPVQDLGPAVANEWHTAYILARADGRATVMWDGTFVVDGPVTDAPSYDGYVEFGSGIYWQTTAATIVDFDWAGSGDSTDLIPEPSTFALAAVCVLGLIVRPARRNSARPTNARADRIVERTESPPSTRLGEQS